MVFVVGPFEAKRANPTRLTRIEHSIGGARALEGCAVVRRRIAEAGLAV